MGNNRWAPLLIGVLIVVGMIFHGCQEGPFGRRRVVTLSPEQETKLGVQAFQQVLQQERGNLVGESAVVDTVRGIGLRLAKASEDPALRKAIHLPDMKFDWEFRVVRSKQINAFCLPGGKVVVYTAILPVCQT